MVFRKKASFDRRSVLKTLATTASGASVVDIAGASPVSTCSSTTSLGEYVGLAYNPQTHEILGNASATFDEVGLAVDGELSFADRRVAITSETPNDVRQTDDGKLYPHTEYQRVDEKRPYRKIELTNTGQSISGYVRYPSREEVAFTLLSESTPRTEDIQQFIEAARTRGRETVTPDDRSAFEPQRPDRGDADDGASAQSSNDEYNEINWVIRRDFGNSLDSDGWEWTAYLTGYDEDSRYDHDELPNGDFTRWNLQSYFTKVPSPDEYDTSLEPRGSDYYITCTPGDGKYAEDPEIRLVSERPKESDSSNFSFSVGIGYSFGAVSVGPSVSVNLDASNTDFRYDHSFSEWDLDWDSFPTDQEENNGVFWTVDVGTDDSSKEFKWEVTHYWNYHESGTACDPGTIIYESDTIDFQFDVPVVDV